MSSGATRKARLPDELTGAVLGYLGVTMLTLRRVALGVVLVAGLHPSVLIAQARRPTAEIAASVATKNPKPSGMVSLVAHVRLPAGLHVQSNKPRDPDLIPTELTVTLPAGVTLVGVDYPKATDLQQPGAKVPLAVYPNEFDIVARVKLAPGVKPGMVSVPGSLRYQACNDSVCFPPSKAAVSWTISVSKG